MPDPVPDPRAPLRLGGHEYGRHRRLVMAIVNRTPDSFYDRGATFAERAALDRVDLVVEQGADVLDVGGVKAAPGHEVSVAEEIDRTAPFVATVRERYPDLVISVDTYREPVARAVCEAGADLLNDTWGGADPGVPGSPPSSVPGSSARTPAEPCPAPGRTGSATTTSSPT